MVSPPNHSLYKYHQITIILALMTLAPGDYHLFRPISPFPANFSPPTSSCRPHHTRPGRVWYIYKFGPCLMFGKLTK